MFSKLYEYVWFGGGGGGGVVFTWKYVYCCH